MADIGGLLALRQLIELCRRDIRRNKYTFISCHHGQLPLFLFANDSHCALSRRTFVRGLLELLVHVHLEAIATAPENRLLLCLDVNDIHRLRWRLLIKHFVVVFRSTFLLWHYGRPVSRIL